MRTPSRNSPASGLEGAHVHFRHWGGSGPPVLLLHSIGLDHRSWDGVAPILKGYSVVAADLPGHGRSAKPAGADYSIQSLARRMTELLDELGWAEAVVVGNSLGGGTGLSMALQAPERVRGLVLVNSVAYPDALPLLGKLCTMAPRVPGFPLLLKAAPPLAVRIGLESARGKRGKVTAESSGACKEYLESPDGQTAFFATLSRLYGDDLASMSGRYGEIHCPTLVFHGTADPLIRPPFARRLAETIPQARYVPVPRTGHFPQEERPRATARAVRTFLDSLS